MALSQVSRVWNTIAGLVLYRHLLIPLDIEESCSYLLHLPHTQRVFAHVKRLSLMTVWRFIKPPLKYYLDTRDALEQGGVGKGFIDRCPSYEEDLAPILNLITQLPNLSEVNIIDEEGGTAELAESILRHHPTCRVSLFISSLSTSKAWDGSPLLHAVCHYPLENTENGETQSTDRLLQSIVHRAPHVRRVSVQSCSCGPLPMEEIQDVPQEVAQIESLCWPLDREVTAEGFQCLKELTDLECLRSWTAGCIKDTMLLQTLASMQPFNKLTHLTLALIEPYENEYAFWYSAEAMLESLPPLKSLCLLGGYTPALLTRGKVLRKHGPTLLELELHRASPSRREIDLHELALGKGIGPIFSDDDILELSRQLPLLKKLQICVQRRRGFEGAAYTALGQFTCLEELELVLNCLPEMNIFDHPVPSRELTDFEMARIWHSSVLGYGWPRWYLRDLLINCAIDEALAKAIFSYVWKGRNGHWLQRLTIYPLYGQLGEYSRYFYHDYCRKIKGEGFLDQLAPTWVVEPDLLTGL